MDRINIRITKKTHCRLNLVKGQMGIRLLDGNVPTLDEVINAGLDLLEGKEAEQKKHPVEEPVLA